MKLKKMSAIILFMALISLFMLSCGKKEEVTSGGKKYLIATDSIYAPFEFQENGCRNRHRYNRSHIKTGRL